MSEKMFSEDRCAQEADLDSSYWRIKRPDLKGS